MRRYILVLLCVVAFSLNGNPNEFKFEGAIRWEESKVLELVSAILNTKDPVILEAGGHYGTDTIKFIKCWPKAKIITFEPNPHAYKKLVAACQAFLGITPVNVALSDYDGEAILHVCYGSTGDRVEFEGASSLLDASDFMKPHYRGPDVVVPCVILDHWCIENEVQEIDFMWLDLEGMELHVLESSPEILKTVQAIYTETNLRDFRSGMTRYEDLKYFLESSGFTMICHWYREDLQGNALFVRTSQM